MHGEERTVQKDKRQEEMHFSPKLIHRPSEHFRKPEVNSSPNAHCRSSQEDIVEMSNDEMADDESAGEIDESSDGSEELLSTYEIMVMRSCIF